ncbi:acetyl-CoA hydrolase/transferase family protein [Zhongshania aliphaticivorans]|uniref:acetyl-CoA hydrolase/transferase family protein n=1 Tax=Zhongshania aliphaticivorans TaxID=1470434 RepID=UPI0012E4FA3C|nr:acetyl-CoA hydrolase/transferase C-terminal domain-containing protein [Zhongshania aliphaticivorans]CAA0083933.1 Butanoate coenzyme A-transferase [Zhongshania aliphaticivorans]
MSTVSGIEQLIAHFKPGDTVFIPGSAGEPSELTEILVNQAELAPGVTFITSFVPGINTRNLCNAETDRKMAVFFMQGQFRSDYEKGAIKFRPISFKQIQQYLTADNTRIDWIVAQVAAPIDGQCSLGPHAEFLPSLLARDCKVLGVINANTPNVPSAPSIPLERFTATATSSAALESYDAGSSNEISEAIAKHIAALIPNGATLQIGLGKIPSQLLAALSEHRELGFHTGMLSDSVLPMASNGSLRKENALTTAVFVGSENLYQQLPTLNSLNIAGAEFTHDPAVLVNIPKLHSINSALEVDILGQVNAETLNNKYVSAPGGLPDFAAAASRQQDGLSIVALPSTDPSGKHSRITAKFRSGTPVSVPQFDVDYVVTEFGAAYLRGATPSERHERIIAIAHPDHREQLKTNAAG